MRLEQVEMVAPDLAAAKFFYHEHLGFPLLETSNTHFSVDVGRSVLRFVKGDAAAFYHIAFLIPSNQVQEAYAWVSQKTEVLPYTGTNPIADFKNWNAEAFYFHDPNQNILEFIAHHDLRYNLKTPFNVQSIIALCEIGIPVLSVPDACRYLNQTYQVPYFEKGPHLPDFAVMGSEEALLIVTTIGRGWLPTQRPAERHFLQVIFTNNETTRIINNADMPQ
jgi:catechol 2,3-dioxygenase-like lactoylglutathione lyase family enzyme